MEINEAWYEYPSNLVDLFEDSFKKFKDRPWIGKKNPSGDYDFKTYGISSADTGADSGNRADSTKKPGGAFKGQRHDDGNQRSSPG